MTEQSGVDERQRGFFWGPNELIRYWVPLIGLDGVGLLNSYDVWCDRRKKSETIGFALPTRDQERRFYGISKSDLYVITSILETIGWLHVEVKWQITGHGRGNGGATKTRKNFYRIINRDWNLALDDVIAVLQLADEDNRIFRRIEHIFNPNFAPIDKTNNPWATLLPQLHQNPIWQKLAERAHTRRTNRRKRVKQDKSNDPNQQSLPETTVWDPPGNQQSLPVTTGKPVEPIVSTSDGKHVVDADAEKYIDPIQHFASLSGQSNYRVSQRDRDGLAALYATGYSIAEIVSGIDRAVTAAIAHNTPPRRFTYCLGSIRDIPPVHPVSATRATSPSGQPTPATEQTATSVVATPSVAPSRALAAMPDSMRDACRQIGELAHQRSLDLSNEVIRDLARLALDYDVAAQRQHSSGIEWTLWALRLVDSSVDAPARYVRKILIGWKTHGCDEHRAEPTSNAPLSPPDLGEVIVPQPASRPLCSLSDSHKKLWEQVLGELELQMTQATFDTWLRGTCLLELRNGDSGSIWIIQVLNQFALDWLENRLFSTIQRTLIRVSSKPADIQFVVSS
ncbi:MAG: hypothetical protein GY832_05850 [Chloroflexi bacterium]|nr:hypothetical protein [Chloroflexota bacterium]